MSSVITWHRILLDLVMHGGKDNWWWVFLFSHTHAQTHPHTHKHIPTHAQTHTCTPSHTQTCAHTHTSTHTQAHTHPHTRPHTKAHTQTRTRSHTPTHIRTHIPPHAHTRPHSPRSQSNPSFPSRLRIQPSNRGHFRPHHTFTCTHMTPPLSQPQTPKEEKQK